MQSPNRDGAHQLSFASLAREWGLQSPHPVFRSPKATRVVSLSPIPATTGLRRTPSKSSVGRKLFQRLAAAQQALAAATAHNTASGSIVTHSSLQVGIAQAGHGLLHDLDSSANTSQRLAVAKHTPLLDNRHAAFQTTQSQPPTLGIPTCHATLHGDAHPQVFARYKAGNGVCLYDLIAALGYKQPPSDTFRDWSRNDEAFKNQFQM